MNYYTIASEIAQEICEKESVFILNFLPIYFPKNPQNKKAGVLCFFA